MDLMTGALEVKHAGDVLKNITEAVVGEEEIGRASCRERVFSTV